MPGAASLRLVNYLYGIAPKDGAYIGHFAPGVLFEPLLGRSSAEAAHFEPAKFTWLGSISKETSVCAFMASTAARILLICLMDTREAGFVVSNRDGGGPGDTAGAPVKHPSIRQLFAYWDAQRGLRRAPERDDIDPGAIRRVLADAFMLAVDARAGHPFRIAGTRVCAAFGRELRSTAFIDLWRREDRQLIGDLLAAVALETIAVVAGAWAESANGEIVFELLLLPIGQQGHADARLLGALAPAEMPYRFGTSALSRLALGSHRFLPPGISGGPWSGLVSRQVPARVVRGLLVYDGGRLQSSPGASSLTGR